MVRMVGVLCSNLIVVLEMQARKERILIELRLSRVLEQTLQHVRLRVLEVRILPLRSVRLLAR